MSPRHDPGHSCRRSIFQGPHVLPVPFYDAPSRGIFFSRYHGSACPIKEVARHTEADDADVGEVVDDPGDGGFALIDSDKGGGLVSTFRSLPFADDSVSKV